MTVTVTVNRKSKTVIADVSKQAVIHRKAIKPALHEIGLIVGRENKRLMTTGKRTGRTYNITGRTHVASSFGEPPASITGRLYKSYEYRVAGWNTMFVGEEASYARFLEDGTRFMKPRQHLLLAINNKSGDAVRIFYAYGKRGLGL